MRLVKVVLGAGIVAGLVVIGGQGHQVLAAYERQDEQAPTLAFAGLDLAIGLTPKGPSPYTVASAPDTRSQASGVTVHPQRSRPPTLTGGTSALTGTVTGPDGFVPGASVRVERSSGDGLAVAELVADELGVYRLPSILGGRYRIRAWVEGAYTMTTSHVLFLEQAETRTVDLTIGPVRTEPRLGFTHRGDVYVGLTGSVAVSVTTQSVGPDGIVELEGVAGALVTFSPSVNVTANAAEVSTDSSGVARFLIECHAPGPATAIVTYGVRRAVATLPACRSIPTLPAGPDGGGTDRVEPPALPRDLVHETLRVEIVGGDGDAAENVDREHVGRGIVGPKNVGRENVGRENVGGP